MSVTSLVQAPSPSYIRTYTGEWINPLEPELDLIHIEDIAHALSNSCRFTGHVLKFYSVAQHSVHVAALLEPNGERAQWDGLLHDASEAYLSDIARPVKRHPDISKVYDEAENRLMDTIAEKYGFTWPMPEEVKWADDVMLRTEQRDLMLGATSEGDFRNGIIDPWTPEEAEDVFLRYFVNLGRKIGYTVGA